MKKLCFLGVSALLCFLPFGSVQAAPFKKECRKHLSDEERDRLFREANLAILKYHQHLDIANAYVGDIMEDVNEELWKTTLKIAAEAALVPGGATAKAITVLITLTHECIHFMVWAREYECVEWAEEADFHLAKAAAWWSTYEKAQTRLLMDE